MKINELFTRPIKWVWAELTSNSAVANFKINDLTYYVYFDFYDFSDFDHSEYDSLYWDVAFYATDKNGDVLGNADDQYGLLGTGNSIPVMTTVIDIITKFVQQKSISVLHFSAKEESRKKLYERIVKKLNQRVKIISDSDAAHYYVYFRPQEDDED